MARPFLAIVVREGIREQIEILARKLAAFDLKPVPTRNLHMTVRLSGEIPDGRIAQIQAPYRFVAEEMPLFGVTVWGSDALPICRRPRTFFVPAKVAPRQVRALPRPLRMLQLVLEQRASGSRRSKR